MLEGMRGTGSTYTDSIPFRPSTVTCQFWPFRCVARQPAQQTDAHGECEPPESDVTIGSLNRGKPLMDSRPEGTRVPTLARRPSVSTRSGVVSSGYAGSVIAEVLMS